MSNQRISSIVDTPKKADSEDLFGISRYEKGLISFIRNADTPITIAIQGEWGSGKTSLMNSLQHNLCGDLSDAKLHKSEFYGIWVNTWQYSLMNSHEETLVSIVTSISTQIMKIISERHEGAGQKISSSVFKFLAKGAKAVASATADKLIDGGGDVVSALMERERTNQTIKNLRDDLQNAIDDCLKRDKAKGGPQKGFIFFIDDLDRIDPPAAVQILELLKNIFDLEHCIFILAIDYDVVVKGLKPKFGELTEKNEREFRSFFDKIIQMPFSMPVTSYNIDNFLIKSLQTIEFLSEKQAENKEIAEKLSLICNLSVGNNPRSLKRLMNTVSLITIISNQEEENEERNSPNFLMLNFAMICIQIAYPQIYKSLSMEPDFKGWDEAFANKMKLAPIDASKKEQLAKSEEFDEEWEQVLYRICERDAYLSNRASHVSQLLNTVATLNPEGADLGQTLEDVLALSAVTDVQAFDKPKQALNKGPVLKRLGGVLLPLLKDRLKPPFTSVAITSKRVMSNIFIGYTMDKRIDVAITVGPSKDGFQMVLWWHPWAVYAKSKSMKQDLTDAGLGSAFDAVLQKYAALNDQYPEFNSRYPGMSSTGTAKGFHVPHITFEAQFDSIDELFQTARLSRLADWLRDFMAVNAEFRALYMEYDKQHNPNKR